MTSSMEKQFVRHESPLFNKVAEIASRTNAEVLERYKIQNLLSKDGSISMDGFAKKNGGPYSDERVESSKTLARDIELELAGISKIVSKEEQDRLLAKWHKDKEGQKSTRAEMSASVLLYRVLGGKFLVMRSSKIDDYSRNAGVDHILVNPETGETLCAFDDVAENESRLKPGEKSNSQKKQEKIRNKLRDGGALVQYGVKVNNGKLERSQIEAMPVFYLSLSDADLEFLSKQASSSLDSAVTEEEKNIFKRLVNSIEEQYKLLREVPLRPGSPVEKNFKSFRRTLEVLKSYIQE